MNLLNNTKITLEMTAFDVQLLLPAFKEAIKEELDSELKND